jgi:hypothetical protein
MVANMNSTRILRSTSVALAAAALAAPAAGAQPTDLRSPDARDAAPTSSLAGTTSQDLRTPDARDAARTSSLAGTTSQDLRTPDARDAAGPGVIHSAPQPVSAVPTPAPSSPGDATPWLTLALGGAAAGAVAGGTYRWRRSRRVLSVR